MIGKLRSVVLDCPRPRLLADFYAAVLGGEVVVQDDTWVVLAVPGSARFAAVSSRHRGRRHGDGGVRVLTNGATRVPDAIGEDDFRVYRDPAGHPFCLVWSVES